MWADVIAIIVVNAVIISLTTYAIFEYSKYQRRNNFIKNIESVALSDLDEGLVVKVIYEKAYHYLQPADSVRGALTKILVKTTDSMDHQKINRLIDLIEINGKMSAIMNLPEEFKTSIYNIYSYCSFLEREAIHLAWRIKDITEKNNNRKLIIKILSAVTAVVTLISAAVKYFFFR